MMRQIFSYSMFALLIAGAVCAEPQSKLKLPQTAYVKFTAEACTQLYANEGETEKTCISEGHSIYYRGSKLTIASQDGVWVSGDGPWLRQSDLIFSDKIVRAAVLKDSTVYEGPEMAKGKKISQTKAGDLALILKKEKDACEVNLPSDDGWILCKDLSTLKREVDAAEILEKVKTLRSNGSEASVLKDALTAIDRAKKDPHFPFMERLLKERLEIEKPYREMEKAEADPDYQNCSGPPGFYGDVGNHH